jgi:large subunit ribosomal protein L25
MSQITLTAQTGRATGSPASRRLRTEDLIPGVIYGQGMTPISLSVVRRDLRLAINNPAGMNTLLSLSVDGKKYPAIIKQIQRHPIRRTVSHIDFFQVNLKEDVTIAVPVRLDGEAKAVISAGGLVDPSMDTIEVTCTPGNMPNEIVIDISAMQPGDVLRIADLVLPAGVVATGDPDTAVATTMMPHADLTPNAGDDDEAAAAAE